MKNNKLTIYLAGKMGGLTKDEYMKWRDLLTSELTDTANINGADIQIINPATYFDFDNMDSH